jgi:hypothetical protein
LWLVFLENFCEFKKICNDQKASAVALALASGFPRGGSLFGLPAENEV